MARIGKDLDPGRVTETEKWIYCPNCRRLRLHNRTTGDVVGWLCQECNPSLEDWE